MSMPAEADEDAAAIDVVADPAMEVEVIEDISMLERIVRGCWMLAKNLRERFV